MRCNELFITLTYAEFQSAHPVWERTFLANLTLYSREISIHPSRVGWDQPDLFRSLRCQNFNPPIPCGMGRRLCDFLRCRSRFQSTHPVWDGTSPWRNRSSPSVFQSTHPVWDGTICDPRPSQPLEHFNPPIPCGMGPTRCSRRIT